MTQTLIHTPSSPSWLKHAARAQSLSGKIWFLCAAAGQLMFVYYILAAYIPRSWGGQFERWNETGLITGHVPGDGIGNLMFITHVLLAAVMTLAGLMQLTPMIRNRARGLHRLSGRVFLVLAVYLAVGGAIMIWTRDARLNDITGLATTLDAVLIVFFAGMALHYARKRQINRHRPWAMRLFIAASAVWFIRIFYSAWFLSTGGAGVTASMDGWFDYAVSYGAYLLPLAVLELYLIAQASRSVRLKLTSALVTLAGAGVIALGGVGATLIMWGPHL
ncbi:DUF2306 domain-containing protein [Oceanicaulis sp. MMSF_3324]|uniref:DUF2306 domain-containing protein n=1 Tax=Oceanicaulis sp. MMSF_3324 TaxID=3046702 RepID=UPI00273FF126|nr:DUF2306 domain-containing protein [Oceanicaulis sp. MMSF_3324]